MQLNIPERITLMDLLPKEGHYADMKTLRRAKEILALTDEEVAEIEYREEFDGKTRNAYFQVAKAVALVRDLPIDEWTTQTVRNLLAKKDKDGKLIEPLMSLYEKFVVTNE